MSIEDKIGIKFKNQDLLKMAFTHSSVSRDSNERLEFLGDAVLGLIVSNVLYKKYPFPEGVLTIRRSELVCTKTLASVARSLSLDKYLKRKSTGMSESMLAGCFESLIGAIYLDRGIRKTEQFIKKTLLLVDYSGEKNWKGRLQEWTVGKMGIYPEYRLIKESGPEHKKKFIVELWVGDELWGRGSGNSIQSAEKESAKMAVEKFCGSVK